MTNMTTDELLRLDYNIYENENLTSETEIEDHFKDNGHDLFECGQGFFVDKIELIVKIDDQFYLVQVEANIESSKQDRGDRVYSVDEITTVTWKKLNNLEPKMRERFQLQATMHIDQVNALKMWFKVNKIPFTITIAG